MKRAIICVGALLLNVLSHADDHVSPRILALSQGLELTVLLGEFDPKHGWISNETFYDAPPQGTIYSLFGLPGKIAEVRSVQEQKLPDHGIPWAWSVKISSYPFYIQSDNLAIRGQWPAPARVATSVVDDPEVMSAVVAYLKTQHLNVPQPRVTQAVSIDLLGDGQQERFIAAQCVKSDPSDASSTPLYSVTLLQTGSPGHWVTVPVTSYAFLKLTGRSMDEQNRLYSDRPHTRWIAFVDIDGDGRLEAVLRRRYDYEPHVDIFSFDGKKLKKVLTNYVVEDP